MNFGHFGAPLFFLFLTHNEFWPFLGPPSPWTFHNVKKHGGGGAEGKPGENCQGTKNKRKQRKQHIAENQDKQKQNNKEGHWGRDKQYSPCFLVKTWPAEGQRRFHKNTAYARLGV